MLLFKENITGKRKIERGLFKKVLFSVRRAKCDTSTCLSRMCITLCVEDARNNENWRRKSGYPFNWGHDEPHRRLRLRSGGVQQHRAKGVMGLERGESKGEEGGYFDIFLKKGKKLSKYFNFRHKGIKL